MGAGLGGPSHALVARGDLALAREEPGSGEPQVQKACDGVWDAVRGDLEKAVVGALAQAGALVRGQELLLGLRGRVLLEGLAELAVFPVALLHEARDDQVGGGSGGILGEGWRRRRKERCERRRESKNKRKSLVVVEKKKKLTR